MVAITMVLINCTSPLQNKPFSLKMKNPLTKRVFFEILRGYARSGWREIRNIILLDPRVKPEDDREERVDPRIKPEDDKNKKMDSETSSEWRRKRNGCPVKRVEWSNLVRIDRLPRPDGLAMMKENVKDDRKVIFGSPGFRRGCIPAEYPLYVTFLRPHRLHGIYIPPRRV